MYKSFAQLIFHNKHQILAFRYYVLYKSFSDSRDKTFRKKKFFRNRMNFQMSGLDLSPICFQPMGDDLGIWT